jgi:hypothetical protein
MLFDTINSNNRNNRNTRERSTFKYDIPLFVPPYVVAHGITLHKQEQDSLSSLPEVYIIVM